MYFVLEAENKSEAMYERDELSIFYKTFNRNKKQIKLKEEKHMKKIIKRKYRKKNKEQQSELLKTNSDPNRCKYAGYIYDFF